MTSLVTVTWRLILHPAYPDGMILGIDWRAKSSRVKRCMSKHGPFEVELVIHSVHTCWKGLVCIFILQYYSVTLLNRRTPYCYGI